MPKRGLNVDEKRNKMLDFFFENRDFFQLKDLEKRCPKEKGIVMQSVKDILQQLVSDGLVDSDKIGTSMYYWAFPSKMGQRLTQEVEDLKVQIAEADKRQLHLEEAVKKAKEGREETEDRRRILDELDSVQKQLEATEKELEERRENDPVVLEQMKADTDTAVDAVNRWTDNIFALKKWLVNKFNVEESMLNKQFGIAGDLDYI